MLNETVAKQILELQKNTFDNAFDALTMWQDQAERLSQTVLDQTTWLPRESRQMVEQWTQLIKAGREDFKEMVHTGFDQLAVIAADPTAVRPTPKKPQPPSAKTAAK